MPALSTRDSSLLCHIKTGIFTLLSPGGSWFVLDFLMCARVSFSAAQIKIIFSANTPAFASSVPNVNTALVFEPLVSETARQSLVSCPDTLSGRWMTSLKTFAEAKNARYHIFLGIQWRETEQVWKAWADIKMIAKIFNVCRQKVLWFKNLTYIPHLCNSNLDLSMIFRARIKLTWPLYTAYSIHWKFVIQLTQKCLCNSLNILSILLFNKKLLIFSSISNPFLA